MEHVNVKKSGMPPVKEYFEYPKGKSNPKLKNEYLTVPYTDIAGANFYPSVGYSKYAYAENGERKNLVFVLNRMELTGEKSGDFFIKEWHFKKPFNDAEAAEFIKKQEPHRICFLQLKNNSYETFVFEKDGKVNLMFKESISAVELSKKAYNAKKYIMQFDASAVTAKILEKTVRGMVGKNLDFNNNSLKTFTNEIVNAVSGFKKNNVENKMECVHYNEFKNGTLYDKLQKYAESKKIINVGNREIPEGVVLSKWAYKDDKRKNKIYVLEMKENAGKNTFVTKAWQFRQNFSDAQAAHFVVQWVKNKQVGNNKTKSKSIAK